MKAKEYDTHMKNASEAVGGRSYGGSGAEKLAEDNNFTVHLAGGSGGGGKNVWMFRPESALKSSASE